MKRVGDLGAVPGTAGRIIAALSDPKSSATRVGAEISKDQGLTATVLRAANSPYYHASRQVRDLTEALVIVGYDSVRDLVIGRLSRSAHGGGDPTQKVLWKHALATALAAQACARLLKGTTVSHAFICGLLHDIGKALLNQAFPQEYGTVLKLAATFGTTTIDLEQQRWGTDHAEVGGEVLRVWQLPPACEVTARLHHDLAAVAELPEGQRRIVAMVVLADEVASWTGRGMRPAKPAAELADHPMLGVLGATRSVIDAMDGQISGEIAALEGIFG